MYPHFPELDELHRIQLDLNQMLRAVEQTIGAARQDGEDTLLGGVHFTMRPGEVVLVAGDGSRVAERRLGAAAQGGPDIAVTVPIAPLKRLRDLLEGETGPVSLGAALDGRYVEIAAGTARLVSHIFEGSYPDHSGVIPTGRLSRSRVAKRDLIGKLQAALLLAPAGHRVHVEIRGRDVLEITTEGSEFGRTRHELASQNDGGDIQVTVDGESLAKAAEVMDCDEVELLTAPGLHVLLRPASADTLTYVVFRMTEPPSVRFRPT
jgi:DNA polymerase-3 subunit beta